MEDRAVVADALPDQDPAAIRPVKFSGREEMPTFIMLSTLTVRGVQTKSTRAPAAVNPGRAKLGCRCSTGGRRGRFDFVNVVEAPDEATIARVSVALGARGSTKIHTLPALDIDEFLNSIVT
jgi:uncharacterized protein with GYD domain